MTKLVVSKPTKVKVSGEDISVAKILGTSETSAPPKPIHYILMVDQSGSMYGDIGRVTLEVKRFVEEHVSDLSLVTILGFSGTGQVYTYASASNGESINYDKLNRTIGLTCFSSPLEEAKNSLIHDQDNIAVLFTDGDPVVNDLNQEFSLCEKLIKEMDSSGLLSAVHTIGYGYRFNANQVRMFSTLSRAGQFFHIGEIEKFYSSMTSVADLAGVHNRYVELGANLELVISHKNVSQCLNTNKIPTYQGLLGWVVLPKGYDMSEITVDKSVAEIDKEDFLFNYANSKYNLGNTDVALDILGKNLRDKNLVDKLVNAFTPSERVAFSEELNQATHVSDKSYRFVSGKCSASSTRPYNKTSVADIITLLSQHDVYYVPSKDYVRTRQANVDASNAFKATKNPAPSKAEIIIPTDRLNFSLRFKQYGEVVVPSEMRKMHNLPETFEAYRLRTHSLILDGNLHVKNVTFLVEHEVVDKLTELKVSYKLGASTQIGETHFYEVNINLAKHPILNKLNVDKSLSLDDVHNLVVNEGVLSATLKSIKAQLERIKGDSRQVSYDKEIKGYNPVLQKIGLEANGMYRDTYDSDTAESAKTGDSYEFRSLKFYVDKFSTIPSVNAVLTKNEAKKKLTPGEEFVNLQYQSVLQDSLDADNRKDYLESLQKTISRELARVRAELGMIKFSVLVSNSWWTGLTLEKDRYIYEVDKQGTPFFSNNLVIALTRKVETL